MVEYALCPPEPEEEAVSSMMIEEPGTLEESSPTQIAEVCWVNLSEILLLHIPRLVRRGEQPKFRPGSLNRLRS